MSRPKYDENLVPENAGVEYEVLNSNGKRKITVAKLRLKNNGHLLGVGHSICSPSDEWSPERGRLIARGRAIKDAAVSEYGEYIIAQFEVRSIP